MFGNQVASSPAAGSVSSRPLAPASTMSCPGANVTAGRGDQLIVAIDGHRVDPGIAPGPWLVDRIGLGRPVIEIPGLFRALADLNELGFDRVGLLRAFHLEGIPALLVEADFLAVRPRRAAWVL